MKRLIDLIASAIGLLLLSPTFAAIAAWIKLHDGGTVFYRGLRAGRHGRPFRIFKFRTMVMDAERRGGASTPDHDPRITPAGRLLRRFKLDELPQLLNVVAGEMSLVGPRPEVPAYADLLSGEEREILAARPGITDWASLWNHDEGSVLAGEADPEAAYLTKIRPTKVRLQLEYVRRRGLLTDLRILADTLEVLLGRALGFSRRPRLPIAVADLLHDQGAAPATARTPETSPPARLAACNDAPLLKALYRTMLRIRRFEERVGELVEKGEVRTPCHLYIGQEAVAAGVCAALEPRDLIWGGHRSHGHYLAKGGDLRAMMAEILGRKTGCSHGRGGSMHLFAPEVGLLGTVPLVAATIPLGVGAALASKLQAVGSVSVCFFGDGALEEGHAHESMNLAALYKLPAVFVCENNFYASHLALLERRAQDNIDATATAHAIPYHRIDGNDPVAVLEAAQDAVARGRGGRGPTLIECRTYRWRGHVGPDWNMDVGVRRRDELKEWLPRDPIERTRRRLVSLGASPEALEAMDAAARQEVEGALSFARESPYPAADEVRRSVFAASGADKRDPCAA